MSERGFRLPENQNNAGIRHVDTTIELQNIATLLSIPELNNYLKSRILKTNVHYFSNEIGGQLWIASLSHGTYGFSNAKIAVNLKEDKFSMIITSYDFDTTLYKKEDFKTYSGTISIYNQKIEMIRENYFKRGRLKQIKVRNGSNFSKIVIHFPPDPGPEPGPGGSNGDWCAVFPPLCDYGGGGGGGNNSGSATSVMMDPGDEGGGGGGVVLITLSQVKSWLLIIILLNITGKTPHMMTTNTLIQSYGFQRMTRKGIEKMDLFTIIVEEVFKITPMVWVVNMRYSLKMMVRKLNFREQP